MRGRARAPRSGDAGWVGAFLLGLVGATDLEKISPLIWVMVAISAGGAIITYAFLVYAVWRFRDPSTRRRNYG